MTSTEMVRSSTGTMALPSGSDPNQWSDDEKALVEAAGLVAVDARSGARTAAPRPVVAAFLQHCHRTGLDPFARQIYCLARKSKGEYKWTTQISIDGARLVAERSGKYRGQTTPEFTADGVTWTQVWLSDEQPKAARVGVYREGFAEPLYAIALWEAYAVYQDEWDNGRKTGNQTLSAMWAKMGPLMLAKCFDVETDVLTDRGFMRFADVTTERIMQATEHGLEAVVAKPFAQAYSGPMVANHGDMLDFTVTPNHDMVTTVGKVEAGAMLATARTRPVWRIPMRVDGVRPDNSLVSDGDLRLAAAIVADGNAAGADAFRVAVSRPAKVAALHAMAPESVHVEHSAGNTVVTKTRTIRTNFDKEVFRFSAERVASFIDMDKGIDLDAMLALSSRQMRVFVDAWIEFDGSVNQKSGVRRLYTSRPDHLRAAELLAVGAGYSVNVARERVSDISTIPNFVLTISEPDAQPVVLPIGDRPGIAQEASNESGVVWCVTVPSGQIVVRRRGFSMVVGNCAEMLALRKAFPQDLSGLYSTEEMDQAGGGVREVVRQVESSHHVPFPEPKNQQERRANAAATVAAAGGSPEAVAAFAAPEQFSDSTVGVEHRIESEAIATPKVTRDWAAELEKVETLEAAGALYKEAEQAGELGLVVGQSGDKDDGSPFTVMDLFWGRRRELESQPEPLVEVPKAKRVKRQWLSEAKAAESADELRAVWLEARAANVSADLLDEIDALAASLPDEVVPEAGEGWAAPVESVEPSWDDVVGDEPMALGGDES